jgi:hypothetical protein
MCAYALLCVCVLYALHKCLLIQVRVLDSVPIRAAAAVCICVCMLDALYEYLLVQVRALDSVRVHAVLCVYECFTLITKGSAHTHTLSNTFTYMCISDILSHDHIFKHPHTRTQT